MRIILEKLMNDESFKKTLEERTRSISNALSKTKERWSKMKEVGGVGTLSENYYYLTSSQKVHGIRDIRYAQTPWLPSGEANVITKTWRDT